MKIFGIITMTNSWEYTSYALKSFFRNTKIDPGDRVFLIDNDGTFEDDTCWFNPKLELFKNDSEQSFAANLNQLREIALENQADLYFLNNDVIFTEDWVLPLIDGGDVIIAPLSNNQMQYTKNGFEWNSVLKLSQYIGKEKAFKEVVSEHRANFSNFKKALSVPFSAVKLPYKIISELGEFDTEFGQAGGENIDYCLRAYEKGFEVKFAEGSYLLHFSGKSTWASGESADFTAARQAKVSEHFERKWGTRLKDLLIENNLQVLKDNEKAQEAFNSENFPEVIKLLR